MRKAARGAVSDRMVWVLIGAVFLGVLLVIVIVVDHDREKPKSPQDLVAAAFSQMFTAREWKPGMGPQPFMYHPAGFERLVWKPLPSRPVPVGQQTGPQHWLPLNPARVAR